MRLAHPFPISVSYTRLKAAGPWDADWDKAYTRVARAVKKGLAKVEALVWKKIEQEARASKAIGDVPDDFDTWQQAKAEYFGETGGEINKTLLEGVTQAGRLGLTIDFELVNQQVLEYARTFSNEWWGRLESTTREGLRTAIRTNMETGAPLRNLRQDITPLFGRQRAEMVAATETTRMFAQGNLIGYREAGVTLLKFETVMDNLVCPDCEAAGNEEPWPLNRAELVPPLHPRCRCWIAPVVEGVPLTESTPPSELEGLRRFESAADGEAWAKSVFRERVSPLFTKEEAAAMDKYKLFGWNRINPYLRQGGVGDSRLEGQKLLLDSALKKQKLPSNVVLYRGLGDRNVLPAVGERFSDAGFISTSVDVQAISRFAGSKGILLEVQVPAGTNAAYLDMFKVAGEREILLPRDLTFEVVKETRILGKRGLVIKVIEGG